jgi:hypothetical protein
VTSDAPRSSTGAWIGRLLLSMAAVLPWTGQAGAQPITFPTTMEVSEGQFTARVQPTFVRTREDPSPAGRTFTNRSALFIGIFGVTPRTALLVTLPYTDRRFDAGGGSSHARGAGDTALFWRRNVHTVQHAGYSLNVAPLVGLKLPTGEDTVAGFPRHLTPGSGSVDVSAGVAVREAAVGRTDRFLSLQYWHTNSSKGYKRGNRFLADGALKMPWQAWETAGGELMEISPVLELNLTWEGRHRAGAATVDPTGGTTLSLTPGLAFARHRMIVELAVQVPVLLRLHGDQLKPGPRVVAGIWWNF